MSEVATAPALSVDDARRLTERIRYTALSVRDGMEKLQRLVQEAKDGNAHVALGFASWTAYLSQTLGSEPLRLARDDRQALVGYLAGEGMSTRAIAPIVGVTQQQVQRDVRQVTPDVSPAPVEYVDTTTGEVTDEPPAPQPRPAVVGLDGKAYKPQPSTTPRRPKRDDAETYLNSVQSLADKAAREADKLTAAQIARIKPNAALWVDGIRSSVETLQRLLTSLTNGV